MQKKVKVLITLAVITALAGSVAYLKSGQPGSPEVKFNGKSANKPDQMEQLKDGQAVPLTSENTGGDIDQTVDAISADLNAEAAIAQENDSEIDSLVQSQALINTNDTYNANEF